MSGDSSAIPRFEIFRSVFIELITRNQRLNEKVNQLEKQHHTHIDELKVISNYLNVFIDQHNDQLNSGQIQMKELKTENEQLQKKFGEYITRFDKIQIENKHSQEQTNQLRQQCQEENRTHIKELENINNHLNTLSVTLNDSLQDNKIQMNKIIDENQQLKEESNNLRKQHQIEIKELLDIIHRVNLHDNEHTDRLKLEQIQMKELKSEHEQFKKQLDEQMLRCNELERDNKSLREQNKELEQTYEHTNQTQIKVIEDTNDRLNEHIGKLRDQLDNTVIQIKRVEDENRQLKEKFSRLNEQNEQQQSVSTKVTDINNHLHSGLTQLDNQSEKNKKLQMTTKHINENHIAHNISIIKPEADDQRQPKTNVQIDEHDDPLKTDTSDGVKSVIFRTETGSSKREPSRIERLSKIFEQNQTGPSRKGSKFTTT